MKILFCSGEAYPFSKTGGLADVAASLPKALNQLNHQVKIITPYYQSIQSMDMHMKLLGSSSIVMGEITKSVEFYQTEYQGVTYTKMMRSGSLSLTLQFLNISRLPKIIQKFFMQMIGKRDFYHFF